MRRKLFSKWDVLLLAILLTVVLISTLNLGRGGLICEIRVDGKVTQKIPMTEDREFYLLQNPLIRFAVRDGAVGFIESDCPDKICVNTGFLRYNGQMAVCLPNRVSIRVVGKDDLDAIAN